MADCIPIVGTDGEIRNMLDQHLYHFFRDAEQNGRIIAEYIWIGGNGDDIRSKTKTLSEVPKSIDQVPMCSCDGSSTNQATGVDSELYLNPVAMFPDPFRRGDNILVLCDTYEPPKSFDEEHTHIAPRPSATNTRFACSEIMDRVRDEEPWFGIEQEYTLLDSRTLWPLGWPKNGFPHPQGPYYCSVGTTCSVGRTIVECHYKACLHAGISISGANAETMPAQWEYQVGPCAGIDMGDQLWVSRYILLKICEMFNVTCTFDPKPVPGDWSGAGGHCNYSSKATRTSETGWHAMKQQIEKLRKRHAFHIARYGKGIERRLTGTHETSSLDDFTWGVANRETSVRVGRMVPVEKYGYLEDRRPASNLDPYIVTKLIAETTLLM
eukprot:g6799.t1